MQVCANMHMQSQHEGVAPAPATPRERGKGGQKGAGLPPGQKGTLQTLVPLHSYDAGFSVFWGQHSWLLVTGSSRSFPGRLESWVQESESSPSDLDVLLPPGPATAPHPSEKQPIFSQQQSQGQPKQMPEEHLNGPTQFQALEKSP